MHMSPEEEELQTKREELAELSDELADKQLALESIEDELTRFRFEYQTRMGPLFVEQDTVQADHLEAQAKARPDDPELQERARQARGKAQQGLSSQEHQAKEIAPPPPPSKELKELQRKLVKENHPDKSKTDADRENRTQKMKRINDAYKNRDLEVLKALEAEFAHDPEAIDGDDVGANLIRTIRSIRKVRDQIAQVIAAIETLKESEWWSLYTRVQEERKKGHAPLDAMAARLQADIERIRPSSP
jgi:hypothetical protein